MLLERQRITSRIGGILGEIICLFHSRDKISQLNSAIVVAHVGGNYNSISINEVGMDDLHRQNSATLLS